MPTIQTRYGVFEIISHDTVVSTSLKRYGEWAENEISLLSRFIQTGSVVADVGAFIGTHSIAFARVVGPAGEVHAFEPRRELAEILRRNIKINLLNNTTVHQVGLGSESERVRLLSLGIEQDCNFGNLDLTTPTPTDDWSGYSAEIKLLDSFNFRRLDLLKADVEGMEAAVIRGGHGTIARCRPVIFAECNSVSGAAAVMASVEGLEYAAFGYVCSAFNEFNYYANSDDMFAGNKEAALVLIPNERLHSMDLNGLTPLLSLDDIVRLMLRKPQYAVTVLGDGAQSVKPSAAYAVTADERNARSAQTPVTASYLHVVVPFYKNEHLVVKVFESLSAMADELADIRARVFFYNDSPGYGPLRDALDACSPFSDRVPFTVIHNAVNKGFIGTANTAFKHAAREEADVIILNSDTLPFPGAFREMLKVAASDPMIGFVSPRSNNATLATLPHSSLNRVLAPGKAYDAFVKIAKYLPPFSFAPTGVGFCLWIRSAMLSELDGFDEIYGQGYNEENDLIMRANRCGYRVALANHAFVWHEGEQSFSVSGIERAPREEINGRTLRQRYPEFQPLIERYLSSPEYEAEDLLAHLVPEEGRIRIAFDFSSFGEFFNGTFEAGIQLLKAALRCWPDRYEICVYMSLSAWRFHGLETLNGVTRFEVHDPFAKVAAIVRIGQPFDERAIRRILYRSPVFGIFMLDAISYDCGYLAMRFDHNLWHFVFQHADIVFTNSEYTKDRFIRRFSFGPDVEVRVSRHSLKPAEYGFCRATQEWGSNHIFVVGNHYDHKFVKPTVDLLASELPELTFVAVGYGDGPSTLPNVQSHQSGKVSDEEFETFYSRAEAVVFPSHYEGFGFPLLHALARQKPIYVRDSELSRELCAHIPESQGNVRFYRTTQQLASMLAQGISPWQPAPCSDRGSDWDRSAREVLDSLERAMQNIRYERIVQRLRLFSAIFQPAPSYRNYTSGEKIGLRLGHHADRMLQNPIVNRMARGAAAAYRRLRRRLR